VTPARQTSQPQRYRECRSQLTDRIQNSSAEALPFTEPDLGRELCMVLSRLEKLHGDIAYVVEEKIARMRRGDVTGLLDCAIREEALIGQISQGEGLRRVVTDRIARRYGMSPQKARALTAAQVAPWLAPPWGEEVLSTSGRLREVTSRVGWRNRVALQLSGAILRHMDAVFTAITSPQGRGDSLGSYPRNGVTGSSGATTPAARKIFEAIG